MTQKFKIVSLAFILILPLLLLGACVKNSGYNRHIPTPPPPAQSAPSTLDTSAQQTTSDAQINAPAAAQNLPAVKVGLLLPLSGPHKNLGDTMLKAAQLALFDTGHTNLELIPRDTKGTPDGAREAASGAVNAGAQIILGPVFADAVRAAKPITSRARVNMIAFSTDWTLAGNNTYIMGFLPFDQISRLSNFAATHGHANIGVLAPDTQYGHVVTGAFQTLAPHHGITISKSLKYPPNTSNLAPVVRQFTDYDARQGTGAPAPYDAVLMPVGGQDARSIASLLTHYGLPPRQVRRLGTGLLDEAALASEANLEGAWFAAPSPNARRSFEKRFQSTYGTKPVRISTLAYDATALTAILAKTGLQNTGRPAFDRNALLNSNGFAGLDGIFRFRQNNTAERGLAVLEFRRDQITVIDEAPKTFQQAASQ